MKRILIFDDDPDILELCSLILRDKGYVAAGCSSCKDCLTKIREFKPDAILMDNWIPDIGGVDATKLIKSTADTCHIPVILFSASNDLKEYAERANADHFLRKPFDIAELEKIVHLATQQAPEQETDETTPFIGWPAVKKNRM